MPTEETQEYFSKEELSNIYKPEGGYQPLTIFEDAVEFLNFFDEPLQTRSRYLYKWQAEKLSFASEGFKDGKRYKFSVKHPLHLNIAAANGSGKDSYFNCPIALYLAACKIRNKIVVTSASYQQLATQTESYIRNFASRINNVAVKLGLYTAPPFLVKKSHIINQFTGSEIILFVTDEPGRAEGHHPPPDSPQSEVCIILNEAKSIPDNIYESLSRCTFTRWIEISSPGGMRGKFYNHSTSPDTLDWAEEYIPGKRVVVWVSSYDCPGHITEEKIEADKAEYGETSPIFRSKHLARFTSIDENIVIAPETVDKCCEDYIEEVMLDHIHVGIDVARGGDENALYALQGNKRIHEEFWRDADTIRAADRIIDILNTLKRNHNLKPQNVNMDEGNVGYTMIDYLKRFGWNVNRVANQSTAFDSVQYGNKGAELYFNLKRLFEEEIIKLDKIKDAVLIKQLKSRYYKQSEALGKITLESKKESRSKGHGSPDRADAFVLAYARIRPKMFITDGTKNITPKSSSKILTVAELAKRVNEERFSSLHKAVIPKTTNHPGNLMRRLLGR